MPRLTGIRDELDRQLIALLQTNARQSTMTLAKRLRLARSTVHERIRRLERDGVIRGYGVLLGSDPYENHTQAVILLALAQRQQRQVIDRIKLLPEIKLCATIGGEFDLILLAITPQLEDLDALLEEIQKIPGVERCRPLVLLAEKLNRLTAATLN
jgi:DNA-binding Lrp family transcriptional regulator